MCRFIVLMLGCWGVAVSLFGCVMTPRMSPEFAQCKARPDRFTRYDNGTVLDTCTQLMWMAQDYRNLEGIAPPRWLTALAWVGKMNQQRYGGYRDWRAATLEEYEAIYDPKKTRRSYRGKPVGYPEAFDDGGGEWCWVEEIPGEGDGHIHAAYTFIFSSGLWGKRSVHTRDHPRPEYGRGSIRLVRYTSSTTGDK